MKTNEKSIFNLIEIFSRGGKKVLQALNVKLHCQHRGIHDFYCASDDVIR